MRDNNFDNNVSRFWIVFDFEFDEINTNADFKKKGTLLIFPSYLRHRVLPVTSGVRRSLVAWFWGPKWK